MIDCNGRCLSYNARSRTARAKNDRARTTGGELGRTCQRLFGFARKKQNLKKHSFCVGNPSYFKLWEQGDSAQRRRNTGARKCRETVLKVGRKPTAVAREIVSSTTSPVHRFQGYFLPDMNERLRAMAVRDVGAYSCTSIYCFG